MIDTVVGILIVLGVVALLATITNGIKSLFNKRKKLEEELEELYCSYEAEEESAKNFVENCNAFIENMSEAAENNFFKVKNHIESSNEVLVNTYNLACRLYEEHKILIEYAKICRNMDLDTLNPKLKEKLSQLIVLHDNFLSEHSDISEETVVEPQTKQGFEVTPQWE